MHIDTLPATVAAFLLTFAALCITVSLLLYCAIVKQKSTWCIPYIIVHVALTCAIVGGAIYMLKDEITHEKVDVVAIICERVCSDIAFLRTKHLQ